MYSLYKCIMEEVSYLVAVVDDDNDHVNCIFTFGDSPHIKESGQRNNCIAL